MEKTKRTFEAVYEGAGSAQRSPLYPGESRFLEFKVIDPVFETGRSGRLFWWTDKIVDFIYGQVVTVTAIVTDRGNIQRPTFNINPERGETTMNDYSVKLSTLPSKSLIDAYNALAGELGLPGVNKFSDKRTAVRRVNQMIDQAERNAGITGERFVNFALGLETEYKETTPKVGPPDVENLISDEEAEQKRIQEGFPKDAEALRDGEKIDIRDEEIRVPEKKTAKKSDKAPKVPRVTKAGLIRAAFENSGSMGITRDLLSEISGHDPKNVGICMQILANADRTKDPITFVRVKGVYYKPEFAPQGE